MRTLFGFLALVSFVSPALASEQSAATRLAVRLQKSPGERELRRHVVGRDGGLKARMLAQREGDRIVVTTAKFGDVTMKWTDRTYELADGKLTQIITDTKIERRADRVTLLQRTQLRGTTAMSDGMVVSVDHRTVEPSLVYLDGRATP